MQVLIGVGYESVMNLDVKHSVNYIIIILSFFCITLE